MSTIKDPLSNEAARVLNGKLETRAVAYDSEEEAAEDGDAYICHARCHTALAASGGLCHFTLTGESEYLHLTRIFINASALTKPLLISFLKNPTRTGGSLNTGMVNKNFTSPNEASSICYVSDAVSDVTLSGGSEYHSFVLQNYGEITRDVKGTNILYQGNSFGIKWETLDGSNAVDGEIISVSINFYVEKTD